SHKERSESSILGRGLFFVLELFSSCPSVPVCQATVRPCTPGNRRAPRRTKARVAAIGRSSDDSLLCSSGLLSTVVFSCDRVCRIDRRGSSDGRRFPLERGIAGRRGGSGRGGA